MLMRLRALLPAALLVAALAPPALAQPSPAQIEAAKKTAAEAADKALDAFDAGQYAEAIAGFQSADKAFHAPKFQLYIARAQAKMGKLVAAKATYQAIVDEKIPVFAPAEFFTAQADAKKELADVTARIPTLQIQVKGGISTASLDGQPVAIDMPIPVDPGGHTLVGAGGGAGEARLQITVEEREAKTAVLEPPEAPPDPTSDPSGAAGRGAAPGLLSRMPVPAYAAYGAAAVGLVVGGVFSGLTLAKKGDYDALRGADPVDAKLVNDAAGQGRAFAIVADVGFLVAIAGAAAGTVVWIVAPKREAPSAGPSLFVAPHAGGMTIGGSF